MKSTKEEIKQKDLCMKLVEEEVIDKREVSGANTKGLVNNRKKSKRK